MKLGRNRKAYAGFLENIRYGIALAEFGVSSDEIDKVAKAFACDRKRFVSVQECTGQIKRAYSNHIREEQS